MGFGKGMAEKLDLPKEVVLDLPLVSMVGQDEVTVENHKGLLEYSAETIRIATGAGRLLLTGEGLELKQRKEGRCGICCPYCGIICVDML